MIAGELLTKAAIKAALLAKGKLMNNLKPVVNYEGKYSIYADSTIISHINTDTPNYKKKAHVDRKGRLVVTLWDGYKNHTRAVSRLMAETFLGEARSWIIVRHKDNNKLNCRLDNLEIKPYIPYPG